MADLCGTNNTESISITQGKPQGVNSDPNDPEPVNSDPNDPQPVNSDLNDPEPVNSDPNDPEPVTSDPNDPEPVTSDPNDPRCSEDVMEYDDEEVDPRVQGELETLNSASDDINTLETELEKSRNKFRLVLAESTQHLNALFKKLGKCVLKARPYYDLLKQSKQAQADAQKAAVGFQRSNSVYQTAKEMVQLAEERNYPEDGDRRQFDAARQEMLNHATIKFMQSEKDKADSEEAHFLKAEQYATIQQKLRYYLKDMPRNINKAKPYFDLKNQLEHHLQIQRMNVEDLQMGLVCAKHKYRSALTNLEEISDDIHRKRKKRLNLPPRTPGVGAESDVSSLPSINLDNLSDTVSFMSLDDPDGESLREDNPCDSISDNVPYTAPCTGGDMKANMVLPGLVSSHTDTRTTDTASVTDKIHTLGQRQAIVEGSESIASSTHQEAPLSPEQLALCPGYVGAALDTSKRLLPGQGSGPMFNAPPQGPSQCGELPLGQREHKQSPSRAVPQIAPQPPVPNPVYGTRISLDTQKTHKSPSKRHQQKLQTQMAFPILQGLTACHRASRPALLPNYGMRQAPQNYAPRQTFPPNYATSSHQTHQPLGGDTKSKDAQSKQDQPQDTKTGKDEVFV